MTVAIVVYILIVTVPLVAAAALTEKLCRIWSLPVRGAWAVTALLIAAIGGRTITQQMVQPHSAAIATINGVQLNAPAVASTASVVRLFASELVSLPRTAAAYAAHTVGPSQDRALAILWGLMSVFVLALICIVYARLWAARRAWNVAEIAGQSVRVAPHAGPAVIGLFRPEIVVPRWVLEARPEDSQLIMMHELEHRSARDPLLLATMWALVALIPWHPGAWYCLARTRLAIELDCDARVVGHGASLKTYAQLLVNQARVRLGAPIHLWLGATSLLEPSSHLERRLRAMIIPKSSNTARIPLARYLRSATYVAIISTIAVAACESHVPTAADISGLDAASAEKNAMQPLMHNGQEPTFYVDGVVVAPDVAKKISPESIGSISVIKGAASSTSGGEIHIVTVKGFKKGAYIASASAGVGSAAPVHTLHIVKGTLTPSIETASPLFLIDGVPADSAAFKAVNPKNIASVEVLKGPAAQKFTANPLAKNGVVMITLKH